MLHSKITHPSSSRDFISFSFGSSPLPLLLQLVPFDSPHFLTRSTPNATRLSEEGVVKAAGDRQTDSSPARSDDLLVLESDTHVPGQMPQAVKAMEEEWEGEESLQSHLHGRGPSSNCRHHRLRLEVPSSVRSDQVGDTEEIEGAREDDASDSVERRGVPGDLRPVDGQVGGDGAVDALFREDLGGFGL